MNLATGQLLKPVKKYTSYLMTEYGQWDLVVAIPEDEPARGSCRGREAHAVWVATSWKQSRASVNLLQGRLLKAKKKKKSKKEDLNSLTNQ